MLVKVCNLADLPAGEAKRLERTPPIAIIRGESGDVYAIDDTCSHADASLSTGYVEDDTVECPLHMAVFCLKTGIPQCPPATKPVRTHNVVIKDDIVFVELDE